MIGRRRLLATGAGLVIFLLTALTPSYADRMGPAIQDYGACLASGGAGKLLILLDTSASLRQTDPHNDRVKAASHLVNELSRYVEKSNVSLDIAVSGFSDRFDDSLPWTNLSKGTRGKVISSIDAYKNKNSGWETDYWVGLNGARKYLSGTGADCSAIMWFSDGKYDLDVRDTPDKQKEYGVRKPYGPDLDLTTKDAVDRVQSAGIKDLCRPGGVADALRVDEVYMIAIGLAAEPGTDLSLMNGIAAGNEVNGSACGAQDASNLGVFLLAKDIGDLFFAFDLLSDPSNVPIQQESDICQGTVCADGTHQFVLDESISSVRIVGGADIEDYFVRLRAPSGEAMDIRTGKPITGSVGTVQTSGEWLSESTFAVTLTRANSREWTGVWKATFVDPNSTGNGVAKTNIRLYGDLQPLWIDKGSNLVAGDSTPMNVGLERLDGSLVDPSSLRGHASVDVTFEASDGSEVDVASGLAGADLGKPMSLDLTSVPVGPAKLRLTLNLTTAAAGGVPGTTLEPQIKTYNVDVKPPSDYPSLPSSVDFGSGENADPVTTTVHLKGDGCAWFEGYEALALPDEVKTTEITSESVSKETCAEDKLTLKLVPDNVGSGLASGKVQAFVVSDDPGAKAIPVTITYRYEMLRPANEPVRWAVFGSLLALGVLIPVLLLVAFKWWSARIPGNGLAILRAQGPIDEDASFLWNWKPDVRDIKTVPLSSSNDRTIQISSRTSLVTKAGILRLAEPGYVVVENAPFVADTGDRLPLALQDHWVAVLDPTDTRSSEVEIVILMSPGVAQLERLVNDVRSRAPRAIADFRREMSNRSETVVAEKGNAGPSHGLDSGPAQSASLDDQDDDW